MLSNIFTIFMAILFFYLFKILYNFVIIVLLASIVKKLKEKGSEVLDQYKKGVEEQNE